IGARIRQEHQAFIDLNADTIRHRISRPLVSVVISAEVVHGRRIEATADPGERGTRHVDLGALRCFVGTARATNGAVDDVHARLARNDADAAGAYARVADVEVAALLGDDGITRELDGLAIDVHEPVAL